MVMLLALIICEDGSFLKDWKLVSDIENKLILILAEDQYAEQEGDTAEQNAVEVSLGLKGNSVNQNASDKAQYVVQRIELVNGEELRGDNCFGVEYGGEVHEQHRADAPQKLRVTEEYHHRGKNESHAVAEHKEHEEDEGEQQNCLCGPSSRNQHHDKEGNKREK